MVFVIAACNAPDIMDPTAVTDQQIADDYNKNKARYTTPEMRTIEQLVFKSADAGGAWQIV